VGHLLSAYHHLAAICRHAGLCFACGAHPDTGKPCLLPLLRHSTTTEPRGQASFFHELPLHSSSSSSSEMQRLPSWAGLSQNHQGVFYQEPAIVAVLEAYSEALGGLVEQAGQGPALKGGQFLLEYPQVRRPFPEKDGK
jgi:hypothetical protein